jgi:hypothetical protein
MIYSDTYAPGDTQERPNPLRDNAICMNCEHPLSEHVGWACEIPKTPTPFNHIRPEHHYESYEMRRLLCQFATIVSFDSQTSCGTLRLDSGGIYRFSNCRFARVGERVHPKFYAGQLVDFRFER